MRIGLALPHYDYSFPEPSALSWDAILDVGLRAEALGFDSAWISDHFFADLTRYGGPEGAVGSVEPFTALAALATRTERPPLAGHASGVVSAAVRADGRLLVSAGLLDGTVRLWDARGNPPRSRALRVLPPNAGWLHGVALTPEGRHVVTANPDGTISVLRLARPGEVYEVP